MTKQEQGPGLTKASIAASLAAGAVAFFIARAAFGPDPNVMQQAPQPLLGRWVTEESRYADRAFVIHPDEYHIVIGRDSVLAYALKEVRRVELDGLEAFQVTYHTRDGETTQEIRLHPDGTASLKNPPDVVWRRR